MQVRFLQNQDKLPYHLLQQQDFEERYQGKMSCLLLQQLGFVGLNQGNWQYQLHLGLQNLRREQQVGEEKKRQKQRLTILRVVGAALPRWETTDKPSPCSR